MPVGVRYRRRQLVGTLLLRASINGNLEDDWEHYIFGGRQNSRAQISKHLITLKTMKSICFIYRTASDYEKRVTSISWSWRCDIDLTSGDVMSTTSDDRAISVYFIFGAGNHELGSVYSPSILSCIFGPSLPRVRIANYIWGGLYPVGTTFESPWRCKIGVAEWKVKVLQNQRSSRNKWINQTISPNEILGVESKASTGSLSYIAVSSDSDNSSGETNASIKNIGINN